MPFQRSRGLFTRSTLPGSVPGSGSLPVRHFPATTRVLERAGFSGERLQRYVRPTCPHTDRSPASPSWRTSGTSRVAVWWSATAGVGRVLGGVEPPISGHPSGRRTQRRVGSSGTRRRPRTFTSSARRRASVIGVGVGVGGLPGGRQSRCRCLGCGPGTVTGREWWVAGCGIGVGFDQAVVWGSG
jgi:hypothetical protein